MNAESELKKIIEEPEKFTPVAPRDFLQEVPAVVREDLEKCFGALRSFVAGQTFLGKELSLQDIDRTYEFVERGLFAYLLETRSIAQRVNGEVECKTLNMIHQYKGLKAQCEAKRIAA